MTNTPLRVSNNAVQELVNSLRFEAWNVPGTTTTVVAAIMPDGWVIATGQSGCVDPLMFDYDVGVAMATKSAVVAATDKAWELLGWELRQNMLKTSCS